jgi:hypothetical protein
LAYEVFVFKPLPNNHRKHFKEPIRVVGLAAIKSKRLFVKVAKQVKWFDADIRAADCSL